MVTADSQTTPYSYITYVIMRLLYVVVHYVMGQIITHIKGQSICTLLICLRHAYTCRDDHDMSSLSNGSNSVFCKRKLA